VTEFNPAILLNTWSALALTSPSFEIMDRRVDVIRVEVGGPGSVLLPGKDVVRLVMREAVSCSVSEWQ
jgi:hypothetical protein